MAKPPASNGSANIEQQGQTKLPEYGTDPHMRGTYGSGKPTDLSLK
jgi:hypothetical protein